MTTLKELRAEHQRLAEKIAAFEVQAGPRYITIPRQVLALDAGDYYAGNYHELRWQSRLSPDPPRGQGRAGDT